MITKKLYHFVCPVLAASAMGLLAAAISGTSAYGGSLKDYGSISHTIPGFSGTGTAGWSVPAGKVILGGGFKRSNPGTVNASFPAQPNGVYPHYTYGPNEYGWNVYNGGTSGDITIYGLHSAMPEGYGILKQTITGFNAAGWAGWSVPAGKVILGGGFEANGPVAVSAPAGPGSVWPHYTYGAEEYGWVVRSTGATTITIHAIYADKPDGYEIVKSASLSFSGTGAAGWSVKNGKAVTGGGFELPGPAMASYPGLPNGTTPSGYTYGPAEYGWLVQNGGTAGTGYIYAIYAGFPVQLINNGVVVSGHNTIQAAIDAATDGNTITVAPGSYTETANYGANNTNSGTGNPVGLLINKSVSIIGVDANGAPITSASNAVAEVISGIQSSWGTNFFVTAPDVTLRGLKLLGGKSNHQPFVNKAIEVVEDNFTLEACVVDAAPGVTAMYGAVYINDLVVPAIFDPATFVSDIKKFDLKNNILRGSFTTANGPGTGIDPGELSMTVTGNLFENSPTSSVTNAGMYVSGNDDAVAWRNAPAVFPTITGNTFAAGIGGLLLARDDDPARLPSAAQIAGFVATNTLPSSAYVTTSGGGLRYAVTPTGTTNNVQVHLGIQPAMATALAGDAVLVGAGTYFEAGQIVIDRNLTITGAGAAATILKPNHATSGGSYAPENGWIAVSAGTTLNLSGVTLDGTNLSGDPQTIRMALISRGSVVIEGCVFSNIASHPYLGWGICILNNTDNVVRNSSFSGIQRIGVHVRGAVETPTPSALIENCTFTGKGDGDWVEYGVEFGGGGSGTVTGCNFSGFRGVASDGSTSAGILATDYYGNGTQATVTGCNFSDSTTGIYVGYGAADQTSLNATNNRIFGCGTGLRTIGTVTVTATPNYWGDASGPSGFGPGTGNSINGTATFSPWWANYEMTILRYGFAGDVTISDNPTYLNLYIGNGQTVTVTATGHLTVGELEIAPGGALVVNGGDLDLGNGSVISGSFTIFNSFGSWEINGDTTFDVEQKLALISDIHVAAETTITVTGGGELILDGCVIDSQTPEATDPSYTIKVEDDGLLTIARCVVTDAIIDIDTLTAEVPEYLKSRIYDSRFVTSDIEASADSMVYHNLFDAATQAAKNTDNTTAFDAVDGWGNVTDPNALQNKFTLDFEAPVAVGRTLDAAGNLFVRPADAVVMKMNVANLATTITGAEALLGYNSGMLALAPGAPSNAVTPSTGWSVLVDDDSIVAGLGMVDSALGLNLSPGNDGISADTNIAKVNFAAGTPGVTLGFFRVQTNHAYNPETGLLLWDTRLTRSVLGVPSYLAAFTANTGELVIDNQPPTIDADSVDGTQVQANAPAPVDVLDATGEPLTTNFTYRNGKKLVLTFTATDAGLAGLETGASDDPLELLNATEVTNDLALSATNDYTTLSDYTVTAAKVAGVVTYTVELDIPTSATNGTYRVTGTVRDRSGNWSSDGGVGLTPLGSFKLANEVLATVELEDFVGFSRVVTFTATDNNGAVLGTPWIKTVTFTPVLDESDPPVELYRLGTVPLEDVPAGTVAISAKTAWNLRSKVATPLTGGGVGSADLTGAKKLRGGDLNGDNVVNLLDYSILRYNWLTYNAVADINGNGEVGLADYNILAANFYQLGDPR